MFFLNSMDINMILAIAKKELSILFRSPMAYLILIVTLVVFHAFFFLIITESREATLRDIFKVMEFLFVFILHNGTSPVHTFSSSLL